MPAGVSAVATGSDATGSDPTGTGSDPTGCDGAGVSVVAAGAAFQPPLPHELSPQPPPHQLAPQPPRSWAEGSLRDNMLTTYS